MSKKHRKHIILFLITIITTTFAGAEWMYGRYLFLPGEYGMSWENFVGGLEFSLPFLLILTAHEFGHYLTAKYYQIKVTLPFYIPMWLGFLGVPMPSFGTMGAFIKIKEKPKTTLEFFDIGIAGPLAGFVIALAVLFYGFYTLPPKEYIFELHPEYQIFGDNYEDIVYDLDTILFKNDLQHLDAEFLEQLPDTIYFNTEGSLTLGSNLLFDAFIEHVAPDPERVPNMHELYHFPWLFAGYLALFFTALNLLPVGQLDGGHVLYGLLGYKQSRWAFRIFFVLFIVFAGFGVITPSLTINQLLLFGTLYFIYLNLVFSYITPEFGKRLLLVIWVFLLQYVGSHFIDVRLNSYVYLLFGLVVGRFLGIDHPPANEEVKLGFGRKVLGWFAIAIFVVSFSSSPFNIGEIEEDNYNAREGEPPGQMAGFKSRCTEGDSDLISPL